MRNNNIALKHLLSPGKSGRRQPLKCFKPGARLAIGAATLELTAALTSEPDKLLGGIGFGPRLLISEEALRATGLLQPGSLVRWHYRLRLPAGADDRQTHKRARAVREAPRAAIFA